MKQRSEQSGLLLCFLIAVILLDGCLMSGSGDSWMLSRLNPDPDAQPITSINMENLASTVWDGNVVFQFYKDTTVVEEFREGRHSIIYGKAKIKKGRIYFPPHADVFWHCREECAHWNEDKWEQYQSQENVSRLDYVVSKMECDCKKYLSERCMEVLKMDSPKEGKKRELYLRHCFCKNCDIDVLRPPERIFGDDVDRRIFKPELWKPNSGDIPVDAVIGLDLWGE